MGTSQSHNLKSSPNIILRQKQAKFLAFLLFHFKEVTEKFILSTQSLIPNSYGSFHEIHHLLLLIY